MIEEIINYLSDWRAENPEERTFIILASEEVNEFRGKFSAALEGCSHNMINLLVECLKKPKFAELITSALMYKCIEDTERQETLN